MCRNFRKKWRTLGKTWRNFYKILRNFIKDKVLKKFKEKNFNNFRKIRRNYEKTLNTFYEETEGLLRIILKTIWKKVLKNLREISWDILGNNWRNFIKNPGKIFKN